ncbi:MAG: four-helix bundle copper-binding protein [Bacillota bacterium]
MARAMRGQREVDECMVACRECASTCVLCEGHCLEQGGRHAEASHIKLLSDCGEICTLAERCILRGSEFMGRLCDVCADVCDRCAQSCEQRNDSQIMQQCIDDCHRCAEACRRMIGALVTA